MIYLCCSYLFTNTGVQHYFHVRWCPCRLTVNMMGFTRGPRTAKPPVEHVFTPDFSGVRVARSLVFCLLVVQSIFDPIFGHCIVCPIYSVWIPLHTRMPICGQKIAAWPLGSQVFTIYEQNTITHIWATLL